MKHVYAALLLHETGAEINEPNLTDVLAAAGDEPGVSRVKALVAALEDVDLDRMGPDDGADADTAVPSDPSGIATDTDSGSPDGGGGAAAGTDEVPDGSSGAEGSGAEGESEAS